MHISCLLQDVLQNVVKNEKDVQKAVNSTRTGMSGGRAVSQQTVMSCFSKAAVV